MAGKKARKTKVSKGIHGGGGRFRGLNEVQKVLMGKGMFQSAKVLQRKEA